VANPLGSRESVIVSMRSITLESSPVLKSICAMELRVFLDNSDWSNGPVATSTCTGAVPGPRRGRSGSERLSDEIDGHSPQSHPGGKPTKCHNRFRCGGTGRGTSRPSGPDGPRTESSPRRAAEAPAHHRRCRALAAPSSQQPEPLLRRAEAAPRISIS